MDVQATLALFDDVAAQVRAAVERSDRFAGGERDGQYGLDLLADAVVVDLLTSNGFGVLSEESGRHYPEREVCVVVDPVDGSTNASRDLPIWATSLCAVDTVGPIAATVVDQSRGVTYRAVRGQGATRQHAGEPAVRAVRCAPPVHLKDSILGINGWAKPPVASRQFRTYGAAAVELCLVADGSLDGYLNLDTDSHGSWDYLGGLLVLQEAGGVSVDLAGRDLLALDHDDRRTILAAADRALLNELLAVAGAQQ